ncbi:unnamed protein product [Symbiodinium natans]|uniref:Uncharacterized protein n=1 Tax=Symbiodinium natans TaxID=878477 RepID=A0A812SWJ8_9DINO|nr:unnamed protein product [Symbiodinium natans]
MAEVSDTTVSPEKLFVELKTMDPEVSREDYYNPESDSWDIAGLEDDLRLSKVEQELSTTQQKPVEVYAARTFEQLFAELKALDPTANEADYYDDASGIWDADGLEDDLRILKASSSAPAAAAAPATVQQDGGDLLFAEIQALDPSASKEDYYDAAGDVWDLDGLKDDLRLAKAAATSPSLQTGPGKLFAELKSLDPAASKADYYDPVGEFWDVEGLEDDLRLAKAAAAPARAAPSPAASPPAAKQAAAAPAPATPSAAAAPSPAKQANGPTRGEKLFAELLSVDPAASKEDYYIPAGDVWDIEGLEDDLRLAKVMAERETDMTTKILTGSVIASLAQDLPG